MAKKPRIAGPGLYHHVYAWGNDRHHVFRTAPDHEFYLKLLDLYSERYMVDIIAYALMDWHIHLLVFDLRGELSLFMNSLHGRYAQYFNSVTGRVGHVFGERFNNKIVQFDNYAVWLSRYIHRQMIEAGITKNPDNYAWTSYRAYLGLEKRNFLKADVILDQFGKGDIARQRYKEFVAGTDEGPVSWAKRSPVTVGDTKFKVNVESEIQKQKDYQQHVQEEDGEIQTVLNSLEYTREMVTTPHGKQEKERRRHVLYLLVNDYHLPIRQVARFFHVSPTTVMNARKEETTD